MKKLLLGTLVWCSLSYFSGPASAGLLLSPHDVSTIFEVDFANASKNHYTHLLRLSDEGVGGELLPKEIFAELPLLNMATPDLSPADMSVVSLRLDPCFPGILMNGTGKCEFNLRLVAQTLTSGKDSFEDTALHLFYDLSEHSYKKLVQEILKLRSAHSVSLPEQLGTHEGFKIHGLSSEYFRDFKRLILSFVGEENLVKVTFMGVRGRRNAWLG